MFFCIHCRAARPQGSASCQQCGQVTTSIAPGDLRARPIGGGHSEPEIALVQRILAMLQQVTKPVLVPDVPRMPEPERQGVIPRLKVPLPYFLIRALQPSEDVLGAFLCSGVRHSFHEDFQPDRFVLTNQRVLLFQARRVDKYTLQMPLTVVLAVSYSLGLNEGELRLRTGAAQWTVQGIGNDHLRFIEGIVSGSMPQSRQSRIFYDAQHTEHAATFLSLAAPLAELHLSSEVTLQLHPQYLRVVDSQRRVSYAELEDVQVLEFRDVRGIFRPGKLAISAGGVLLSGHFGKQERALFLQFIAELGKATA